MVNIKKMNNSKNHPYLSIVIPTYNSEELLKECIFHIKKQTFKDYEIIVCDGGSTDNTLKLAKKYNCIIIKNKLRLAEPGIYIGMKKAKGSIIMILAVDNFFKSNIAFETIAKIFKQTSNIYALFPKHDSLDNYSIYTRYTNMFTDPFNHYLYGYASNGRTFYKVFNITKHTSHYDLFDFKKSKSIPLIAIAQGITIRSSFVGERKNMWDDIEPMNKIIKKGKQIGFLHSTSLIHNTTRDLNHFIRKQRWAVNDALIGKGSKFKDRKKSLSKKQNFKIYFYPIYSFSLILPFVNSFYHLLRDKEILWIWHTYLVFISSIAMIYEFVIIKFKRTSKVSRL